ncbi:MAG: sulfite exporter TauE/SafE family protein [Pseudomonadota bacterium]|nr:MAG: sulfite exporter TauE/SafE family protein [Pseudomonadota bacterium]
MLVEVSCLGAFLVGLLGGVHCVGMCGGIVGALTMSLPQPGQGATVQQGRVQLPLLLAYNAGRILSYTLAGAALGGIGYLAAHLVAVHQAQLVLKVIAGLFMIALGLYLGNWWRGLTHLERAGAVLWRRLEPHGRRFLPVRTLTQGLMLGLIWGWLPCGLVYSVLIWSISAGSAVEGALLLLSFGLGTLPNLLAMGVFAAGLTRFMHRAWVRNCAGALVMGFGVYTIVEALQLN